MTGAPVYAQTDQEISIEISAGLDGYYKDGHWIPIRVLIENNGPVVDGSIEVSIPRLSNSVTTYRYPLTLPTTSRKLIYLTVFPEGFLPSSTLKVSLVSEGREITAAEQRVTSINPQDRLIGVLAGMPSAFNGLADVNPPNGNTLIAQLDPGFLPDTSQALSALDVIVISDIDTGGFSEEQIDALTGWVTNGGQLLVTGGPGWQKTNARLVELLPLEPTGTINLRDLSALREYAGPGEQSLPGEVVVATGVATADAESLIKQGEIPLLLSRSQGNGSVIYLAADSALEPLRSWTGMLAVYQNLFNKEFENPGWSDGFQNWDSVIEAAKSVVGLSLPLSWMFCGFLGLYVLVVGPLNLVVLNRIRRRELAWVTIPVVVITFSALAFILGSQFRGGQAILNRLAIIQVWPDAENARVDGTIGLFSPHRKSYELNLPEQFSTHPIPNTRQITGDDWAIVEHGDGVQVADIRLEVGELATLAIEGTIPAPAIGGQLKLDLNARNALLIGEVTNQSEVVLHDAILLVPGSSLPLGDLLPGESRPVQVNLLASGRSLPGTDPASISFSPTPNYYYYLVDNQIFEEILGSTNYYDDPVLYRRYQLLSAALTTNQGIVGRDTSVYLAGWSDSSPIHADIGGDTYLEEGESLYIVALPTELDLGKPPLNLPPAMFSWSMLSAGPTDNNSPYNTRLYPGEFSLQYRLSYPVEFTAIDELILHLTSGASTGASDLNVSLWDYTTETWYSLSVLSWGDYNVPQPEKFVNEASESRVKVENTKEPNGIAIEAIDFSMIVDP